MTDTISAFVDGEFVDPDQLATALEDPEGRATLVDFVRMRAAMRAGEQPLPASLTSLRPTASRLRVLPWPAVAALFILVFLAGLLAPRPWAKPLDDRGDTPPAPTRVERFTPGVDWHPSN